MATEKLYYSDCHLASFTATVLQCAESEKGYQITLDRTAFYPEGGGQPCDLGTLGEANVLDVQENREEIIHFCSSALPVGATVEGRIDYARRFDLMQQHSGEHMVSGVIHRRYGFHNVGFHMGADFITIDFDGIVPEEAIPEIEQEVNRAIWQDLLLHIWYPTEEELPSVPYRTKRALPWPVRVVEIPNVDICACCGVHVATTGEIGLVKIFSCIRFRQGVRMEIACGERALSFLSRIYEQNRLVSQAFSAKMPETGLAAQRMNEALAAEKYRASGLEKRIFDTIAQGYQGLGNVVHFEPNLEPSAVRELADRIAALCGGRAAVFSGTDEAGYSFCVASRSDELKDFGKEMTAALNGRGGGKAGFLQGSVRAGQAEIGAFFTFHDGK